MRNAALILLFAFVSLAPAISRAESRKVPIAPARVYQIARLTGPAPAIDGRLDDACWRDLGEWTGDFTQREPREGAKASLPTQLKVLYDDRAIYVAIRAFDPDIAKHPRLIGARDQFTGDMVGINFDSYHDQRAGFEFDVTSGGSKLDLILRNDGSIDMSWNPVWDVKTAVEKDAWTAEFRIPLSQLRYQSGPELVWGMHCWRWIAALQEESDWNLLPMDSKSLLYSFGELRGLDHLPTSRRLEIAPYAIAKLHRYAPEPGNPFRKGSDASASGGLDLKYGISTNLTLDATVNPDFSQVDADPSEINLSTVETFHTERRLFFLEGKDTFDFGFDYDQAFYSRRIGAAPRLSAPDGVLHDSPEATRILGSAKLTGTTQSGLAVGVLHAALDRATTRTFGPGGYRTVVVEPRTNDSVVRLQQELDHGNTLFGGIVTSTLRSGADGELQILPRRSLLFGVDGTQYFSNRAYFAEGRVLATDVRGSAEAITTLMEDPVHNYQRADCDYLDVSTTATRLRGNGGFLRAGRGTGLWRGNAFVSWRSPGVDFNDLGYMQVADFITPGAQLEYFNATAGSFLRRRDVRLKVTAPSDYGNETLGRNIYLDTEVATLSGAYMSVHLGAETSILDTHVLRGGPALRQVNRYPLDLYAETDGGKPIQWKMGMSAWTSGEGARSLRAAPGIVWKPTDRLETQLSLEYTNTREPTQYAGTASGVSAPVYVMAGLRQHVLASTLRLTANFTPTLSLSYYGGPFATTGRYSNFKTVERPRASSPDDRFAAIAFRRSSDGGLVGTYRGAPIQIGNPDFNWREFKSNLVFRWEYRPGSFLYCVWSQYRSDSQDIGGFAPTAQYRQLYSSQPDNTLLVKLSYWFSL